MATPKTRVLASPRLQRYSSAIKERRFGRLAFAQRQQDAGEKTVIKSPIRPREMPNAAVRASGPSR